MDSLAFAVIGAVFLAFALVSRPLADTPITPALVFAALGAVLGPLGLGLASIEVTRGAVELLAEITLALLLFSDAARINLRNLRTHHTLPFRMLVIGLPLTIVVGTGAGFALFPWLGFWEVALLAALLAPTDAALGQAVMSHPEIPTRIRQALNVESGLNDGLALPAVLFIATCAAAAHGDDSVRRWTIFAAKQLGLSPVIGLAIGFMGGRLVALAGARGLMTPSFEGLAALAIAALAYLGAELMEANGFISVFVAGMALGALAKRHCDFLFEFAEAEGQLLALATFLVFGLALLPETVAVADWAMLAYAALSLTLVRMVPVSLSLVGTGLGPASHLFLGWFGPRGLATVLFGMLIVSRAEIPHREEILGLAMGVVALSIVAHGLTAAPFARLYGRMAGRMGPCAESEPVPEMRLRVRTPSPMTGSSNPKT